MFFRATNWEPIFPAPLTSTEQELLLSTKHWLFTFSGGGDSVLAFYSSLSWLSQNLQQKENPHLTLLYFDHQLPYSKEDTLAREQVIHEALTAARQMNFKIDFISRKLYPDRWKKKRRYAFEFTASQMRRRFISTWAHRLGLPCVVVHGHSLSDWYETVNMRLQRGTSLHSLAPLPAFEEDSSNQKIFFYRPLCMSFRDEIRQALEKKNIHFWQDPSNEDLSLERNFVREKFFVYKKNGLRKTAQNFLHEKKIIEQENKKILSQVNFKEIFFLNRIPLLRREIHVDYFAFEKLLPAQKFWLKSFCLKKLGLLPLSQELKKQLEKNRFHHPPYSMEVENWNTQIFLVFRRGNKNLIAKPTSKNYFSAHKASPAAEIQFAYGRKKIKKIFSELKISHRQRRLVFLCGSPTEITCIDMSILGLKIMQAELRHRGKS